MKKITVAALHLGYWMMYSLLWLMIYQALTPPSHRPGSIGGYFVVTPALIFAFVPAVAGFYTFYSILFSKFLKQKKILFLSLAGVSTSILSGLLGIIALYILWGQRFIFNDGWNSAIGEMIGMSFLALIQGIIALVIKGFITWYEDIKLKEELNKKNYEMELALIKSQINPHFLFNTLNNIDVLIERDSKKASDYLNKLSDIMRFMLYETKTEKITLSKELAYIEKYIELQKIRTSNPNYVNYTVEGDASNLMIEPMLFIPLIENAFKHAENKKVENAITIKFAIEKDKIIFDCENSSNDIQTKTDHNGLGNELIQKRLSLLYPNKHTLVTANKNNTYKVHLILFINEN